MPGPAACVQTYAVIDVRSTPVDTGHGRNDRGAVRGRV